MNKKKSTEEREITIQFDSLGDFAAVKHETLSARDCDLARSKPRQSQTKHQYTG